MKAIALISGGLDSTLAAKLVKGQGIDVIGLKCNMPFCSNINKGLSDLGIRIEEEDITEEFLELVNHPGHGFGSQMNPCIDCKILMLKTAKELMQECSANFVITGEVLGQRPMSQHRQALLTIAERAGLEGLVLRPLSAQLLPETLPEKEGWVRRKDLLSFSGRGRRQQMALASSMGIREYAQPAGGCLLTDPEFAKRLKDLIAHEGLSRHNIELLKIGRHFRLSEEARLVVGRNQKENERLSNLAYKDDYLFMPPDDLAGPTSLGRGVFGEELIKLSCAITCRYCDIGGNTEAGIGYRRVAEKENNMLKVSPIEENRLLTFKI